MINTIYRKISELTNFRLNLHRKVCMCSECIKDWYGEEKKNFELHRPTRGWQEIVIQLFNCRIVARYGHRI